MAFDFRFDEDTLNSVVGGESALGIKRLNIHTAEQAAQFIKSYGFDINNTKEIEKIAYFHRRALVLLQEKLGYNIELLPDEIKNPKKMGDFTQLLLLAGGKTVNEEVQRLACGILRVMHVYVHAETDLFSHFAQTIQNQVIIPIENSVKFDGSKHKFILKNEQEEISLLKFETKPFKTSSSTVIKLLAKPDAIAMKVYDKLGVRFVTQNIFDSFRVIRFLTKYNLISFPHVMPDQSTNTIYPIKLFIKSADELANSNTNYSDAQIEYYLQQKLEAVKTEVQFVKKENIFSASDYKFIKFIARKRIMIPNDFNKDEPLIFFYPFEVQIMDESSFVKTQNGLSDHKEYKERQKQAALKRIFPHLESTIL